MDGCKDGKMVGWMDGRWITTTIGGYFAIQISSQTPKKKVSESPLL
jgi:hypothetical protein